MIEFAIDLSSGVATYRQLADQVRQALRLGNLGPGDQLPTVREVVAAIAVNGNPGRPGGLDEDGIRAVIEAELHGGSGPE